MSTPYGSKRQVTRSWYPLLLAVSSGLQLVCLFVAMVLMLTVRPLLRAAYTSLGQTFDTTVWLSSIAAFVAALITLFVIRKRPTSLVLLLCYTVAPALLLSAFNYLTVISVRGLLSSIVGIVMSCIGAALATVIFYFAFDRSRRSRRS